MSPKKPKPELQTRSVRLTDKEYDQFKAIGGNNWLRERLTKMAMPTRVRSARNTAIRIDAAGGMSDTELAKKYGVDRATIWRVRQ